MTVRSRLQEAAAHNPLVALALGVIATFDEIERALDDAGDVVAGAGGPAAPLADDDPIVLAALGLVALRRALDGWLAAARDGEAVTEPDTLHDRAARGHCPGTESFNR